MLRSHGSKISGSQQTVVLQKLWKKKSTCMIFLSIIPEENSCSAHTFLPSLEKKIDMHDFPEHNSRGEFMQCPYASSFVGQCKCPSLSRNTFATKVTSTFRRNSVILKYIKVKLLLCKLSLKRGFNFSIVMYG